MAAWSLAARAQQPVMPVIGFLNAASADKYAPMMAVTIIAVLINPTNPNAEGLVRVGNLQAAARTLGLQLHILQASSERDLNTVFPTLVKLRLGAFLIVADPFLLSQSEQLAAPALRYAVPAIFQGHEFAAAGRLMSYGGSVPDSYRLAGGYAGRILKGKRPSDLPVQQSTKLELLINMKTAKARLTIPPSLLAVADEVIE